MSQLVSTRRWERETAVSDWHDLYKIGGVAAILQLVTILAFTIVSAVLGPRPETFSG
jgi:hypothetical protein